MALICRYAGQLAVPYRYKLGIAILEDALNSDTVSKFTTANRASNIELMKSWTGFYDSVLGRWVAGKYTRSLNSVVKFIAKEAGKSRSECIVCTGLVYQSEVY